MVGWDEGENTLEFVVCEISREVSGVPCFEELLLVFFCFDVLEELLPSEYFDLGDPDLDLSLFLDFLRCGEPLDEDHVSVPCVSPWSGVAPLLPVRASGGVHPRLLTPEL